MAISTLFVRLPELGKRARKMDWIDFIRNRLAAGSFLISRHADIERNNDSLSIQELEFVLGNAKVLEDYPDDPRGPSCLMAGNTGEGKPVHCVCGKTSLGDLILITVYLPGLPKWIDSETRAPKPPEKG